jgi:hypothetical protein
MQLSVNRPDVNAKQHHAEQYGGNPGESFEG